ncbi:type-F conjugative transfer system pilin acetylase TraX [Escherichia coli]|uniref:type-F conjugative transfer system pilin acetylase TraX n=1 Tax=Escherichia coli TaxID=562 RepID=UPI0019D08CD3|nr:type-F conjugative transfer system pilin acetylase TraX [Escherichia coli]MBN6397361.1 type-F conjugative transfer system pilin acetylase TraX [Escherichia coli]
MANPDCFCKGDVRNPGTLPLLLLAPLQRDVVKIVAFLAMAGDHIATVFHVGSPWLNLTGQCAFPLFALMAGCNLAGRQIRQAAVNRLWLMAVLAQPVFWLTFRGTGNQWWQLNILFCFAAVIQTVCYWQRPGAMKGILAGKMLVMYLPLSTASYGMAGLVMLLTAVSLWLVPERGQSRLFLLWLCAVVWLNGENGAVVMLAGVSLTMLVLCLVHECVPASSTRLKISRWFAEGYVLHLLIIAGMVNGLQVQA